MDKIYLREASLADAPKILEITKKAFTSYAEEVRKKEKISALYETLADVERDIETINVYVCEPVSYTHLDVYKRQKKACAEIY